jgi:uncharacterized membrane protein YesL
MLKSILKSNVLKGNVYECESELLKTTVTSYLKAYKTDNILGVRLNLAFIISIYNYLFVKELNTGKLAL